MKLVMKRIIDEICCDKMEEKLAIGKVTYNEWNFFYGGDAIFFCPFCGKACH